MSRENLLFRPSSLEIKVFSTRQYHMYELTRYKHTLIHTRREVQLDILQYYAPGKNYTTHNLYILLHKYLKS